MPRPGKEEKAVVREVIDSLASRNELSRVQQVASMIVDTDHLKRFLWTIDAGDRKSAYYLLKPHLSFRPPPYMVIND